MNTPSTQRISVGSEMGHWPLGWLLRRHKRLADLLEEPAIMDATEDLVKALDAHAAVTRTSEADVDAEDAKLIKGMDYLVFTLA